MTLLPLDLHRGDRWFVEDPCKVLTTDQTITVTDTASHAFSWALPMVPEDELWLIDRLTTTVDIGNDGAGTAFTVTLSVDDTASTVDDVSRSKVVGIADPVSVTSTVRTKFCEFAWPTPVKLPELTQLSVYQAAKVNTPTNTLRWAVRAQITVLRRLT